MPDAPATRSPLVARVRAVAARSPLARRLYTRLQRTRRAFVRAFRPPSFSELPPDEAVRMAYNVMLRREPDPMGRADFEGRLLAGAVTPERMVDEIRGSEEFIYDVRTSSLGHSIHAGRCAFIQSLPKAARILDLGGTHKYNEAGAMVRMGYPYAFEKLVIVDLPNDDRHPIYQDDVVSARDVTEEPAVQTRLGPVSYRYHSMIDLSGIAEGSFDLVYMGQSIEHVTEADGDTVLAEVHRVLRPGGHLALDTPNGRVTRRQQAAFVDPDHEVEYTYEELAEKLKRAGFDVVEAKGMNYAGPDVDETPFSMARVAGNTGLFAEARD